MLLAVFGGVTVFIDLAPGIVVLKGVVCRMLVLARSIHLCIEVSYPFVSESRACKCVWVAALINVAWRHNAFRVKWEIYASASLVLMLW